MVSRSQVARKISKELKEANNEESRAIALNLLLGILDAIAGGRNPVDADCIFKLLLESEGVSNIPREVAYEIGKAGFGLFPDEPAKNEKTWRGRTS